MNTLRSASLLLFLFLAAGSAAAHPWDAKAVSATSGQLVQALDALLADPKLDAQQATAMQQREHEAAISTARRVRDLLVDYKRRIAAGYSREDSRPFWDQIDLLRGDIQAYARNSWLPATTGQKADRVNELFDQLAHYYRQNQTGYDPATATASASHRSAARTVSTVT